MSLVLRNSDLCSSLRGSADELEGGMDAHFLERGDGERFVAMMDSYLPNWRSRHDLPNGAPLSHKVWAEVR